jgi:hypothetical protein
MVVGGGGAAALTAVQFIPGVDVIVDAVLIVGAIGLGAYVLAQAYNQSQAQLKEAPQAQACSDCGDGPDCFEPPDRSDQGSTDEFRRQLKGQEDGINKMSPREVADNIDKFETDGREGYPTEAADRKAFRQGAWNDVFERALDETGDETIAEQQANAALKGKAALHNPDLAAGGRPQPTDLGGLSENSSIGSQWAKVRSGSKLTRSQQLRKAAEKAMAQGKEKMDVKLKEC